MIKLGKVFNAPIILTTNFLIYAAIICGFDLVRFGIQSAFTTLLAIAAVASCVLLHEIGHVAAGQRYGVRTDNISLNFFGGIAASHPYDWYKLMDKPKRAMFIWICGPAVNIVLIGILSLAILAFQHFPSVPYASTIIKDLAWIRMFNLGMAIFNLLPLYPLDGGGIFYCILRLFMSKLKAIKIASVVSMLGCAALLVLAIKYKALVAAVIAIMIFLEARHAPKSSLFR